MSNGPAGECQEQHLPLDDELWDTVAAITERIRGKAVLIAVNMTAAALVVTGVVLSEGLRDRPAGDAAVMIGVAALCAFGAVVIGYPRARRRAHRASGWVRERRPATAAERRSELWWARSTAVDVFAAWALSAVVLAALGTALGYPEPKVVRIGVLGTLAGCGAASMSFLLLEQIYRPVLQLALAGHAVPGGITLGLRWRLMLLWVLSGAAPISVLGTAWVGHTDKGLPVFLSVNAALSLVWGVAGTYLVAQSLIDPVTGVRAAQRRVQDGDLAVQIPVDHDGEVGQLQAGFNHMVAGLREHQRLNDIFGRHVGIEVARTALARGVRLGGERRPASVLFFDLIGSTAMTQRLPPEEVVALLNDVFTVVVDCVSKEGGWVNKFEGDAALVVFGPPAERVGHAGAALRAARAVRTAMVALAERYPGLDAGIGVSSGQVIAGNIGSADRYEYTVIGDPVNEAARLTEQAKKVPERLLASHAAVADAGDEATWWQPHQPMLLRGRSTTTETYVPVPRSTQPQPIDREFNSAAESPLRQDVPSAHGSRQHQGQLD